MADPYHELGLLATFLEFHFPFENAKKVSFANEMRIYGESVAK